jgi:hypothetical protein
LWRKKLHSSSFLFAVHILSFGTKLFFLGVQGGKAGRGWSFLFSLFFLFSVADRTIFFFIRRLSLVFFVSFFLSLLLRAVFLQDFRFVRSLNTPNSFFFFFLFFWLLRKEIGFLTFVDMIASSVRTFSHSVAGRGLD